MGTSHERYHVNLAAPVKATLHEIQSRLLLLVESGPRAMANDLSMAASSRNDLTKRLLDAIALELNTYADEEGI